MCAALKPSGARTLVLCVLSPVRCADREHDKSTQAVIVLHASCALGLLSSSGSVAEVCPHSSGCGGLGGSTIAVGWSTAAEMTPPPGVRSCGPGLPV